MKKVQVYHSIGAYLKAKQAHQQAPAVIRDGKMYILCKGEWMPKKEWEKHNPKPVYEPAPRCNPDGTHIPAGVFIERH